MSKQRNTESKPEIVAEAAAKPESDVKPLGPAYQIRKQIRAAYPEFDLDMAREIRNNNQLSDTELASGKWAKLADVDKACRAAGVPISRFVKAFGGDRLVFQPMPCAEGEFSSAETRSHFTVKYRGRTRYLPASALTIGVQQLLATMKAEAAQPEAQ